MSLCLINVFLFGQREIISFSSTPSNYITGYNPLIFYFIGAILSSIFTKKKEQLILQRNFFPFLIFFLCFSSNPLHKSKK